MASDDLRMELMKEIVLSYKNIHMYKNRYDDLVYLPIIPSKQSKSDVLIYNTDRPSYSPQLI